MRELVFVIDSLGGLLVGAFLLRLLLQWARADFRNPVARAVLQVTNPLVLPLRRLLPPLGALDTAAAVAVILVQALRHALVIGLSGFPVDDPTLLLAGTLLSLADTLLLLYMGLLLVYVVLSWVSPSGPHPLSHLLWQVLAPLLRPFRALPSPAGIDLAPFFLFLALQVARMLLARLG
ncbi:MAG: YggT family protein [Gammaproteobacteria bacterium]